MFDVFRDMSLGKYQRNMVGLEQRQLSHKKIEGELIIRGGQLLLILLYLGMLSLHSVNDKLQILI